MTVRVRLSLLDPELEMDPELDPVLEPELELELELASEEVGGKRDPSVPDEDEDEDRLLSVPFCAKHNTDRVSTRVRVRKHMAFKCRLFFRI